METEIQDMLDLGVIEPSISPYSSPIVLVPKKDGSVRFCIDFRRLNKVTEFDAELMPNMEEIINGMRPQLFLLYNLIIHSSMNLFSQRSRQFILSFFQVFEA